MSAIIDTLAPSFWEKETQTIENLKRQMVLIGEDYIKLLNKKIFKEDSKQKPYKVGKIWRLCFK